MTMPTAHMEHPQVPSEEASPWITTVSPQPCIPRDTPLSHAHHLPGECKDAMMTYLACIKKVKGVNENQCRNLAKSYLNCRMDR